MCFIKIIPIAMWKVDVGGGGDRKLNELALAQLQCC